LIAISTEPIEEEKPQPKSSNKESFKKNPSKTKKENKGDVFHNYHFRNGKTLKAGGVGP
jgi:hypothetical protein